MPNLNRTIESLAATFAADIIRALRRASLEEILGESRATRATPQSANAAPKARAPKKVGQLGRRTVEQIQQQLASVVALLKKNSKGMRSEAIRAELKLDRREIPRVLAEGLKSKAVRKTGAKRATTYRAN